MNRYSRKRQRAAAPRDRWHHVDVDRDRASMCGAKTRYTSRHAAARGVRFLRERGADVHAYPCRYCNGWHVGHNGSAKH